MDTILLPKLNEPSYEVHDPVFSTTEDLLAIACHFHRNDLIGEFTSLDAAKLVTEEDRMLAQTIRKHYNNKLIMQSLNGVEMSSFKTSLREFINADFYNKEHSSYQYSHNYFGMAIRLPSFYEYDTTIERIAGSKYRDLIGPERFNGKKQLKFIESVKMKNRRHDSIEYWFTDEKNNLVMVPIPTSNPLNNLFLHWVKKDSIQVEGTFYNRARDNVRMYKAINWSISNL